MAAGTSSRFVPLSAETPKGLLVVKGEILIERQIRQLQEAGIDDITIIVGYMAEKFEYLKDVFKIKLVINEDYYRYNNTSSLIRVLDKLANTYICSSDNYFPKNVFLENPYESYYSAMYSSGFTKEYCLNIDTQGYIHGVTIGGHNSWYMLGHVYFSEEFSTHFKELLNNEYQDEKIKMSYWEDVYMQHIDELPRMRVRQYREHEIEEFDTLDELREFDNTYIFDTRSHIVKFLAQKLKCDESSIYGFKNIPHKDKFLLFSFNKNEKLYEYNGETKQVRLL